MPTKFVIKFQNGRYYTGRAGEFYQGPRSEAFVYGSIHGAVRKKMLFDAYYGISMCKVVQTLLKTD